MTLSITIEYQELVNDLIENRIGNIQDEDIVNTLRDVLKYGQNGYINMSNEELIAEAMKKNIYGSDINEVNIIE